MIVKFSNSKADTGFIAGSNRIADALDRLGKTALPAAELVMDGLIAVKTDTNVLKTSRPDASSHFKSDQRSVREITGLIPLALA